jgi:ribosome-binding factor A
MSSYRKEMVSSQIKKIVSELIEVNLADKYGLISITEVLVSADFKEARIYISIFNKEKSNEILNILKSKSYAFQNILKKRLKIRYFPKLLYILDEYQDSTDKVENIIRKIENES